MASFAAVLLGSAVIAAEAACDKANAIGIARTITIDANGGQLYGGLQYGANNLLRDKEVILTFDDGPLRRHTRKVLEALAAHCTKGTFFMVGRMAVADPAMVREVADAGHTIAHHTWSHKNLQSRSARSAGGEIELGISAVQVAAKRPTSAFFRFPYLADPNSMIAYGKSRNLAIFSIDIDSHDYKTRSSEKVYSNIMGQLRARQKGIMLFHDIQPSTANAMARLLNTMQREGFKIVHVVSKSPVTTIAEFDKQAEELHSKRRTNVTAQQITGGDFENAPRINRRPSRKQPTAASASKVAAVSAEPRKPALVNPFSIAPPNRQAAPERPQPSPAPAKDWRSNILGN